MSALAQSELVVRTIAQTAVDNEKYFCELDAVVGDGDFGYSLARGFEIVLSDWDELGYTDPGTLLKKTAIVLTKRIGGTSGPIWGTAFLRAGGSLSSADPVDGAAVITALRAAIEGIKAARQRGRRRQDAARRARPRRRRARGGAGRGRSGRSGARIGGGADRRREHQGHARHARPRVLHGRALARLRGRGGDRRRGHVRGRHQGVAAVTIQGGGAVKKFVNDPKQFVPEMLKGIALANPGKLKYVPEYNLIMRTDSPRDDKVSIIQGSGSGHEPAHVMAVGPGMLDAACPGDVFAAPPSDYVYETTKLMKRRSRRAAHHQQLHGRPHGLRHGPRARRGRGHQDRDDHRRRRRRREGLDLDRRPPRRGGQLLRHQGGRRGVGARRVAGGAGRARQPRQQRHAHDGHGADVLHAAGQGLAAVRARRRRDGDGRRHPRRAWPPPREAGQLGRDHR